MSFVHPSNENILPRKVFPSLSLLCHIKIIIKSLLELPPSSENWCGALFLFKINVLCLQHTLTFSGHPFSSSDCCLCTFKSISHSTCSPHPLIPPHSSWLLATQNANGINNFNSTNNKKFSFFFCCCCFFFDGEKNQKLVLLFTLLLLFSSLSFYALLSIETILGQSGKVYKSFIKLSTSVVDRSTYLLVHAHHHQRHNRTSCSMV